ncbi:hypothetical protein [Streptomyces sp. NPDC013457]
MSGWAWAALQGLGWWCAASFTLCALLAVIGWTRNTLRERAR